MSNLLEAADGVYHIGETECHSFFFHDDGIQSGRSLRRLDACDSLENTLDFNATVVRIEYRWSWVLGLGTSEADENARLPHPGTPPRAKISENPAG